MLRKKLLLIILLIVGCAKNSTEPEVIEDCNGELGGTAVLDACGVCGGDALSCEQSNILTYNQSTLQAFYFFTTVTINNKNISPSDWVGAFNNNVCVGARQWNTNLCGGGTCDVPVMGDDGSDVGAGYMQTGDIPSFKIYDTSEKRYYDATPSENIPWTNYGINSIELLNATTTP